MIPRGETQIEHGLPRSARPGSRAVLNPLMSEPSELIATGPVISTDLIPSDLS
jgi:hypothetical protein